jgi:cytochrome c oxidase subunit 1
MFGRMMNQMIGKIHFWLSFIAFNCTFFPMHILGVGGHMRRIYNPMQYEFLQNFEGMNIFISISAFVLGIAQLLLFYNVFVSMFKGKKAEDNPWQANTLEWVAPSPPPHGNFEEIPTVYHGPYEYNHPDSEDDWISQANKIVLAGNGKQK